MSFQGTFTSDNWHREARSISQRNGIRTRRWGMRVTVYLGGSAGDYVLSYGLASTNIQDNNNWLLVANIGATWGGGGVPVNIYTADGVLTGDRILDGDGNSLTFDVLSNFTVNPTGDIFLTPGNDLGILTGNNIDVTAIGNISIATLGNEIRIFADNPNTQSAITLNGIAGTTELAGEVLVNLATYDGTNTSTISVRPDLNGISIMSDIGVIDIDGDGINLQSNDGGGVTINDVGQGSISFSSDGGGIVIQDGGGGSIQIQDSGQGSINIESDGGGINIEDTGTGGVLVIDSGPGGGGANLVSTNGAVFIGAGTELYLNATDAIYGQAGLAAFALDGSGIDFNSNTLPLQLRAEDLPDASSLVINPNSIDLTSTGDIALTAGANFSAGASDIGISAINLLTINSGDGLQIEESGAGNLSILTTGTSSINISSAVDINLNPIGDFLLKNLAGSPGEFFAHDGTWAVPAGGGASPAGANTEIQINTAGAFGAGKVFIPSNGNLTLGDSGLAGGNRLVSYTGSSAIVGVQHSTKGNADYSFYLNASTTTANRIAYFSATNTQFTNSGAFIVNDNTAAPDNGWSYNFSNRTLQLGSGTAIHNYNIAGQNGNITNNQGGQLLLRGGDGQAATNGNGGDLVLNGGDAAGAGTPGNIVIDAGAGLVRMPNLPVSSAGLSAGDVWNNGGVLSVV